MIKRNAVYFLTILALLSILALVWQVFLNDNRSYLQRDPIRLIDDLSEGGIRRSPFQAPMETIRKEPLNQGWKRLAALQNEVEIWQTRTAHFIVSPSREAYDAWTKIYRRGQVLQNQPDLFRADTKGGRWNAQGNLVLVSVSKGEDPNKEEYFIDYRAFGNISAVAIEREVLKNPIACGLVNDGSEPKRVLAYPLKNPIWVRSEEEASKKIVVRKEGQVMSARPDMLENLGTPPPQITTIFPQSPSPLARVLVLARSSDRLSRHIEASPGLYVLRLEARASLAGSEPPIFIIKMNGREIARQPVNSEKWTPFYFRVPIKEPLANFDVEFTNDYFERETGRDRNIYISRIDLWPDPNLKKRLTSAGEEIRDACSWSWLDDSEDILYEATPLGMFRMFTQKDFFTIKWFMRPGIVSLEVTAQADLAGEEYPKLAVYLDKIRVGELQVTAKTPRQYATEIFAVTGGWRDVNIVFENDFVDPTTREDRNIYLTRIVLKRRSALLVSESLDQSHGTYIVSYPSKAPFLAQLQLQHEFSATDSGRINPITYRIDLGQDMRSALVCPPRTELTYRVQIPKKGRLNFSYGALSSTLGSSEADDPARATKLVIKAKEAFHFSRTLFSLEVANPDSGSRNQWREAKVNLESLAGKKVRLSIETRALRKGGLDSPIVFLGDPVIASGSPRPEKQPNIILITADALRADHLSCYGYQRKTSPNIDQFARKSVVFKNAIAPASWTLPALASLFTSLYPSYHGANAWNTRLLPSEETLPKILKKNGYTTVASVNSSFLFPAYGLSEGYDFYDYGQSRIEEQLQSVSRGLESMKGRKFFFYIHFLSPHATYRAPFPFCDAFGKYDSSKLEPSNHMLQTLNDSGRLLSLSDRNYIISQYDGAVLYLDDIFKRLLDRIQQLGLYQNTLIIFSSDHGEQFQEHGGLAHGRSLYQGEIHIPLIIKAPSGYGREGLRISTNVSAIDIPTTVLDLIKVRPPDSFQGRSLLPLLQGQPLEETMAFAELNNARLLAILKWGYKYLSEYSEDPLAPQKSSGISGQKSVIRQELYDLKRDPGEAHNLAASRPDLLNLFYKEKETFMEFASRFRQTRFRDQDANRIMLDDSRREQLRALGYIR